MKWSEQVWTEILPIYHKILELPFIAELMDGTLPREKFIFYINQDRLYLAEYGKILAGIMSRVKKSEHAKAFLKFSTDTVYVEGSLHETYLSQSEQAKIVEPSPSCLLYTGHLHQVLATAPVETAIAAVLPCFKIYKKVGEYILENCTTTNNPYKQWIDTYGGTEFEEAVTQAMAICDELAEACSKEQQQSMTDAFVRSAKLEWMFWDSAWRMEQWAV
ncbi:thiaminase II [uncultured Bacteroides sp.]|uniref:thiaminase II n=1 Tax=uncultured Bacteroides sp. TaxID=162156 RepID=UPI002AAB07D9|nr:thiaminase II [uncultured Bacteroides sp.]